MSQAAEIITALLGAGGLGSMFQLFRTSADVNEVKRSEVPSLDKRVDTLFEIVNGQNDAIDGLRDENKAMGIKLDDLRDALHITMDYAEALIEHINNELPPPPPPKPVDYPKDWRRTSG